MINAIQSNSVYWRTQHVEKKQDTKENNVQKHEEQEVVLELGKNPLKKPLHTQSLG